ncbi:MAG: signal transduction histidine kinase/ligand-binding sensor domain-containing protein [Mariniflexile sp.]|jgi:signal transduction histidine kinase/ligand-binding sensor domain-containing protein/CheY-like chemotaxis protein
MIFKNKTVVKRMNLYFIFYFICSSIAYSQAQVNFRQLSVKEGLSQNSAISITQDSIGYLWIATQDGLNKYEGREFFNYPFIFVDITKPNYSNLGKVYTDRKGNVWIIPINKIPHKFNVSKNEFVPISTITDASTIFQDSQFNIWVGTYSNGLYLINPSTLETKQVLNSNQVTGTIFEIVQKSENGIILAAGKQLMELNIKTNQSHILQSKTISGKPMTANFSAIVFDKAGNQWQGTYGDGLYFKDDNSDNFHRISDYDSTFILPNNLNILDLHVDKKNRLWIATYGDGLYLIDLVNNETKHFLVEKHNLKSLNYNDILCIYEDYSGVLWFGTDGAGISYYDEYLEKFNVSTNYQTPEDVSIDLVRAITVEKNGTTWIGTSGKGLTRFEPKANNWKSFTHNRNLENSISSNRIVSLLVDNDNDLWIGTQDLGLNILNSNNTFLKYSETTKISLSAKTIWCIFKDYKNNYWLGTRDNGLIKFDKKKGEIKKFIKTEDNKSISSNNIRVIVEDKNNNLWIGTDASGLLKFDPITETFITYVHSEDENSLSKNNIKSLYYDTNDILWIGTNGGGLNAFHTKKQQFYHFSTQDGLANDVIYGIVPDAKGNLWLSSNKGITRFTPSENFEHKPTIINYTNYDGLSTEFNTGAYFKSENGDIYFGSLDGFYSFNPNNIVENSIVPKTAITKFEVFNKSFPLHANTVLKSNENTISFTFSSLQFSSPQKNEFKYKLTNIDENWVENGNKNYVRYTNLPAGEYTFYVKSSNYDGFWNETPKSFSFKILKPWYLSNWAVFVYILLFIITGYLPYIYFKWRWKIQLELKLKKEEASRLKEINDYKNTLYANISHEFRTPLTLINGSIINQIENNKHETETNNDLSNIHRNTSRLIDLVDQMLELTKVDSGVVKVVNEEIDIAYFLQMIIETYTYLASKDNLSFNVAIADNKKISCDTDILEKIINNLLSNAIKYATKGSRINFMSNLNDKTNELELEIENDIEKLPNEDVNKLFERFYRAENNIQGTGIGLSLVKELVHLLKGTVSANYTNNNSKIKFLVNLPITFIETHKLNPKTEKDYININNSSSNNAIKPLILIVDDNQNIRNYIKSLFFNEYTILEAKNGLEGVEKALHNVPDLIISDVSMPIKTGIELCNYLKNDEKTSHIPIVLLTAKVGNENEMAGLLSGADAYITKPFNPLNFQIKIKNIIDYRVNLQNKYFSVKTLNIKDIAFTTTDEMFLQKVQVILDKHLNDSDFTAQKFSKMLSMNRMQLHRKLIALTGQSTTSFISIERLKQAASLLEKNGITVAEVAYATGFNTPSYFIKSFKELYGKTPLDYIKK